MMKDIYELLNEVEIGQHEFKEMNVSEQYADKIKQSLKASIRHKKSHWGWKRSLVAAVIVMCCSFAALAVTSPVYAYRIPVFGDLFRYLNQGSLSGLYDSYKSYSSDINLMEESSGIRITIENAIYDGETVAITYSIESSRDLGETPYLLGALEIADSDGSAGSNQLAKVDGNHYAGLVQTTAFHRKNKDTAYVNWDIESITVQGSNEKISGNWRFTFALQAIKGDTLPVDHNASQDGVQVSIDKISFTPLSFILYYDQFAEESVKRKWNGADVDLTVKDDLGHVYAGKINGGSGSKDGFTMSWSKTFEQLDRHATKLIITPRIRLYPYTNENHGGLEINRDGTENPESVSSNTRAEEKRLVLDDIVIDLKDRK